MAVGAEGGCQHVSTPPDLGAAPTASCNTVFLRPRSGGEFGGPSLGEPLSEQTQTREAHPPAHPFTQEK